MPIERRSLLKSIVSAAALRLVSPMTEKARAQVAAATRATPTPKIKDITVIETAPAGSRLTVVKITTDQPGLYGYGCATFTQRADLVKPAVERYLKPLLMGKSTDRIEDIWQTCYASSYWKNGPVLNNAISGVDQALWDIKGRQAGMPVYDLVGGKCREAADTYAHADGQEIPAGHRRRETIYGPGLAPRPHSGGLYRVWQATAPPTAQVKPHVSRCMISRSSNLPTIPTGPCSCSKRPARNSATRSSCSTTCMSASRPTRPSILQQAEHLRMFFLEDPLSPEDIGYFQPDPPATAPRLSRWASFSTARTSGLRSSTERLIDYIRCHVSQVGGFTPGRKIAILAENYRRAHRMARTGRRLPHRPHGPLPS